MPYYLETLNKIFPNDKYTIYTKQIHNVGRMLYTAVPKNLNSKSLSIEPLGPEFRDCWDIIQIGNNETPKLIVVNLHAPMAAKYRLPICKHVAEKISKLTASNESIIIIGDLNTFSDELGLDQIRLMENEGFKDVTNVLLRGSVNSTSFSPVSPIVRVLETFDPYPYDNVPRDKPEFFPYNLDHVLVKNIPNYSTVLCYDQERDVVFNGKHYGNSDHFALSFSFTL